MRWLRSDGKSLVVREVGPVVMRLVPVYPNIPLKVLDTVEEDDAARERLRTLLGSGLYRAVKDDASC